MEGDPFLAMVERVLADSDFLLHLARDPDGALAVAGLALPPAELESTRSLAARCGTDHAALVRELVAAAVQRQHWQV